jgi:16S rRNA (cytosine967-C5)-methyltransferase
MPRVLVACTEAEASRVRPLALRGYEEARSRGWPFLSDVLARVLSGVPPEDAAATTALLHALVKYDRLLAFASGSEDAEARWRALLALAYAPPDEELDARIDAIASPAERLGVAASFPDWLVQRIAGELGDAALEPALAQMNAVPPRTLRANTLRAPREETLRALASEGFTAAPTTHASQGIVVSGQGSLFRSEAFARGDFEVQDEASQLVAELVAPPPRSLVVDACAGAGGKTLALAALLGGRGRVLALDTAEHKLEELRRRARRAGASNVEAMAIDLLAPDLPRRWAEAGRPVSARVLLDAPCSGLGAIRRNPEARWRLRPDDLDRLIATQAALVAAAASLVGPHGRLIVATCSFLPSEGERAVERFLADDAAFERVTARDVLGTARSAPFTDPAGRALQTWRFSPGSAPDGAGGGDAGMDGFFAAVVRRRRTSP